MNDETYTASRCMGLLGVPAAPRLFHGEANDGSVRLVGVICEDCGARAFPSRPRCPKCFSRNVTETELEQNGVVESFTIIRQRPPGYRGPVPYTLGMVRLGTDLHVLTHLAGKTPDDWMSSENVQLCAIEVVPASPEGEALYAYAFKPSETDSAAVQLEN